MQKKIHHLFTLLIVLCSSNLLIGQIIFEDDFESGSFKPQWTITPGDNDGLISVIESNSIAYEGFYGVAIGKESDGEFNLNTLDLNLDLSSYQQVELSFWIKDLNEDNNAQDGIYFSDDGGQSFTKVFAFDAEGWVNNAYGQLCPLDIDKLINDNGLNLTSQFVIRFQQYGNRDFGSGAGSDGLYIDNVVVQVPQIEYSNLPFFDDFEESELKKNWKISHAFIDGQTTPNITNVRPGGLIELVKNDEDNAVSGFNYVNIGRLNDGELTTNAFDLHLNLEGESQAELTFWIRDVNDDNHSLDGIYFSDNGGRNFTRVYTLDPEGWNNLYGQFAPISIDKLAKEYGLNLTSEFIIRFQQHGDRDLNSGAGSDGFKIDDVSVKNPTISYASVPFFDDFEKPVLNDSWRISHAFIDGETIADINDVRPGGFVGLEIDEEDEAYSGFNYVALGRLTDGSFTASALDLHVRLAGITDAELNFWINDFAEENHSFDGIYFSNDGGLNFRKVYTFDLESLANFTYHQISVNINDLASTSGITLSNQFVIRFQQYGNRDFGSGAGSDGIFLDDIQICVNNNCTPAQPSNINVAINSNAATCNQANGSLTANATGGSAPYTYNWSNGATGAIINTLSAGNYTLTVTDNTGATTSENATVANNGQAPTADFTFAENNGIVTFQTNSTSGCSWDFGDGNQATNCNASNTYTQDGTYTITLTVTNSCESISQSEEVTINNETSSNCESLSVGIATRPIDGCLRSFKAVPSGGTPPYSFLWRDGQMTDSIAYDISVNPDYAYTVTDSAGCTFSAESVATCTPTNTPPENDCTEADIAFLAGNWTGTFTGVNEEQSSMIVEIVIIDDNSFWGVMTIPSLSSDPRFLFGICSGDSINWSGFEDLDNIELEDLYISPGGRFTETSIDGDYYNTDSNSLEGTFELERTCSYPLARFTPIIKANGEVTFQNESHNNPTARFWEFGDGGEAIDVSPTHTYTQNGDYEVTLVVANSCREDTLRQMITIDNVDGGIPPTKGDLLLYAGEVEGNVGEQVLLPILIENLDTITVLEGQIILDNPSIGQIIGTQAGAIDVGTINPANLRIVFFATNGLGIALNPKDTLFYLVVELTGAPNDTSTVTLPDFDVYGTFNNNNFTPLPYDTQNGKITIVGNFNITGSVQTFDNRGIEKTTIDLQITLPDGSQDVQTTTTLNDGSYSFQDVPAGSTCTIKPKKDAAIKNGLSTAALFLGQRYILGLAPPQINSPFQLFAGDANCDDQFSTVDLFLIQKVLVEIDDSFADCEGTWGFTPEEERKNFTLNMDYHNNGAAPNDLTVTPTGDIVADFIGVKKGDILNLADPSNLLNDVLESRSKRTLPLEVRQIVQEETVEIAFYPSQTAALASYQLAFDLDGKDIAFQQLIGGTTLPISNVTADGQLLVSWFTPNGEDVVLNTAQPIFSLQFDKQELDFSQIALAEQRLEPIGFTTNLDKWKIQLIASEPAPTVFKVYQNTPNPFRQHTVIRFDLPQATPVQLHISNSLGQLVHQQQANYEAGQHQIAIADLNLAKGWYLYTVATNKHQATKKMLIIE